MPTPAVREPGAVWTELPRPVSAAVEPAGHVRLGYARASTARQSLDTQLDSLAEARITRVFSEKISTRATARPELEAAVKLAGEIRAFGVSVALVVHEHKRLGRGIELAMLAEALKASDVGLEFLTGELKGSHDPSGIVFTVLAAMSGMEREYIRDRTLEGHESARKRGKTIGGVGVTDDDMLFTALRLRDEELSLRDIAARLVISKGARRANTLHLRPSCACCASTTNRPQQQRARDHPALRLVSELGHRGRVPDLAEPGPEGVREGEHAWREDAGPHQPHHDGVDVHPVHIGEHHPEAHGHGEDQGWGGQDGEGGGQLSVAVEGADEQVGADDQRGRSQMDGSLE
ncbi:recombinase family protein [Streptomyces sp. PSKA30]|uniref:recombinase family protein n=1 Tax=Streptomyces sp. PSKA30 TaxID=2874597 RepID=UPI001CD067C1|nr:recombinase family protein [Streptomyces sp. PSKA30]MBZ9643953.1 recombinase family protein [Streptomyces sp. PSKA30]